LNALFQGPAIFKALRENKIDVIINENILYGLITFIAAGKKVLKVFDFSDYFPESASVYYADSCIPIKKLVEGVTLAITKLNIKFSNVCFAVCQSLINATAAIDKNKPTFLITNGVHTRKIAETQSTTTKCDSPSMVVMGVIDAWLDFQMPLQALRNLKNRYPGLKLIIIGPWQRQEFRRQFEDKVKSLELDSSVEITGYISSQRLKEYLSKATCFIMPYRLDQFYSIIRLPEKLFVYSAYGKLIISTPLPEVKALGTEHVLFYRNLEEFTLNLTRILNEQEIIQELESKAKAFAQNHDFSVLAKRVEKILQKN
jgi:phosphatidyl-myo-inositol dimannoside synthase